MAEVRLVLDNSSGDTTPNDADCWYAEAVTEDGRHLEEAVGPTESLALGALARKLANTVEDL